MFLSKKIIGHLSLMAMVLALVVGCGKKPTAPSEAPAPAPTKEEAAAPAPAAPAAPTAPAAGGTGSIKGKVSFTGTAPEMPELNRASDPFCAQTKMKAEDVVVNSNNTLKNVAVTVSQGAPVAAAPTEAAVVEIDQKNCMYTPRVLTSVAGQTIKIVNSDPTLHNVHTYAGDKTLFNRAQPKGSPAIDKSFSKDDGLIIKFKCDVHPWMTGWLIQGENALNAVTGDTGEFEIKNVSAGKYTLQAWHEKYGTKTVEVTVEADKAAEASFSYDGTEKAAFKYQEVHIGHLGHSH